MTRFATGWLRLLLLLAIAAGALPGSAIAQQPEEKDSTNQSTEQADAPEAPQRCAFKLGDFRIKNFRPVEREQVTLEFTVFMEAPADRKERFERIWQNREHRVRNQIITSARLVPPNDFEDPTLEALRRRIYLRLRRAVPELPLGEVYISDFSYIVE